VGGHLLLALREVASRSVRWRVHLPFRPCPPAPPPARSRHSTSRGHARQSTTSTHVGDGLALTDCWVTSPVKCAPPANQPTAEERHACAPFLTRELDALPVEVVVTLGGIAWAAALAHLGWESPKPRFTHGAEYRPPGGPLLLGCYHVSQQNTFTGRLTEPMLDAVFAKAAEFLGIHGSTG
jgi:uracil-DNA glycosylase